MGSVYLLWHSYELNEGETEDKLLGVYSSEENALARIETAKSIAGFVDHPNAFIVSKYTVDKDHWTEGFVTTYPES